MLRLILVRHGETSFNHERRLQGSATDIELNETGREQVKELGEALKSEKVNAIYASPMRRARETALAIASHHGLTVQTETKLTEINTGDVEGLTIEQIEQQYSHFWKEWTQGTGSLKMPGGESLEDVRERAWGTIQRIYRIHPDGTVIVVCHTLTLLAIICAALNIDLSCFRRLRCDVAGLSILNMDGQSTSLVRLNDTCHLKEAPGRF